MVMVVREPAVVQCVVVEKKFSSFFIRKKESIIHDVGNMHMHAIRLLQPINDRFRSLREGNGMETTLMSDEEKRFMWNLAFFFTLKHRVAAFKAYYAIRSFITYNGIFMGPGYDLGDGSIWRRSG